MTTIDRDSLMTLEAYAKIRKSSKPEAISHRRLRSVQLGEHITVQFEDERTIRRQIQEMLHIEKIFDEDGIQGEIDAYAPLIPDGTNWKASMLREYPDPHQPPTLEEALDCLRALRRTSIEAEVKRIQSEIGRLEKSGDGKGVQALLFRKQDLTKELMALG